MEFYNLLTLLPMLRGICRRVFAKPRKFLKNHEKYAVARTQFQPIHFAKYQLDFNFTRGLVQVRND